MLRELREGNDMLFFPDSIEHSQAKAISSAATDALQTPLTPNRMENPIKNRTRNTSVRIKDRIAETFPSPKAVNMAELKIL
mgnify:CR=1 FL=1